MAVERKTIFFPEQEELFKQRTGKEFTFFYQKYYPKLLYYTSKMCQSSKLDTAKAEDISTESFLIAFEKIEKYEKEKSQFSTWLFTIAKNLMLQEIKNEQKTISMDVQVDEEGTTMKDFLQEEESDQHLQDLIQMKADIMMKKISELKEPYKQVIQMREINKMVYKDIASDLGTDITFNLNISNEIEQLPMELSKVYSISNKQGIKISDYTLIEGDTKKTPFFTQIKIAPGDYQISGRQPKPLSTIKSQIRNGRALLIEATEKEYRILDEMYK
jgi:RNA polymerase sigma factor (sigma-70 family)